MIFVEEMCWPRVRIEVDRGHPALDHPLPCAQPGTVCPMYWYHYTYGHIPAMGFAADDPNHADKLTAPGGHQSGHSVPFVPHLRVGWSNGASCTTSCPFRMQFKGLDCPPQAEGPTRVAGTFSALVGHIKASRHGPTQLLFHAAARMHVILHPSDHKNCGQKNDGHTGPQC